MAMTMIEVFDSLRPPVRILATDIDTDVLAVARLGIYPLERLETMSSDRIRRFFLRGKSGYAGYARVRPELRDMITFRQLNLLDAGWPLHGPFEAIFCRNVMIYFNHELQDRALELFHESLCHRGFLGLGSKENLEFSRWGSFFEAVDKPWRVYRKK